MVHDDSRPVLAGPRRRIELDSAEALRLLGSVSLGRIVCTRHALPTVRPVNHALDDGDIVIRTHEGAGRGSMRPRRYAPSTGRRSSRCTAGHPARRVAEIVLGVDSRNLADTALDFAFDSARLWGVRLRAVHAWSFPSCAAELPFGVPEEDRAAWADQEVQLLSDALRSRGGRSTPRCACWRTFGCSLRPMPWSSGP